MKLSISKKILTTTIAILLFGAPIIYSRDSRFDRNGECYISASGIPGEEDDIWRINNPEQITSFPNGPHRLNITDLNIINSFAVDLDRTIYIIASPTAQPIDESNYTLYRQVLDNTNELPPTTYNTNLSIVDTVDASAIQLTNTVTEQRSDWGAWSYVHTDSRGFGAFSADWYKIVTSSTDTDENGLYRRRPTAGSPGSTATSGTRSWYWVKQPLSATLPAGKTYANVLPNLNNSVFSLPYYNGKAWYQIPNGAWYSSWKSCNGYSGYGTYYQAFRDYYSGNYFDWNLYVYTSPTSLDYGNADELLSRNIMRTEQKTFTRMDNIK